LLAPEVRQHPDALLDQAERLLSPYGVLNKYPRRDQSSNRFVSDEIRGLGIFSSFMPVIFLVVAARMLNVLVWRLVEQQRTIIGTLKATGYDDRTLLAHYLKYGMAVGLVGGLLGWVCGYYMGNWVTRMYRMYFEFPELSNRIYPGTYLLALLISL